MPRKLEKPNIPPDSCNHIDRVQELVENLSTEIDEDMRSGYNKIINEESIRGVNKASENQVVRKKLRRNSFHMKPRDPLYL